MAAEAMDAFLAQYYGTDAAVKTAAAVEEDTEKQASVELFMKIAADQNIALDKMSPADVQDLYDNWIKAANAPATTTTTKTAAEEEKEKKVEEAKKELEEKKAHNEKIAEADFLGRVMAHAYCQELRKIAEAAPAAVVKTDEEEQKEKEDKEKKEKGDKEEADKKNKGHMPPAFMQNLKHGSAVDTLAVEQAMRIAKEAGFSEADVEQAGRKVAAVLELGIKPSEKIAGVTDVPTAVGIRALELLEAAGYPVTWAS